MVTAYLPPELMDRVEEFAARGKGNTISGAINRLIWRGLRELKSA